MSIGVCVLCSLAQLQHSHTHTQRDTYCMSTHTSKHIQSSLYPTNKHKHIKSSSLSLTNALTQTDPDSVHVYGTEQTQAHEKCMSLCVFHKKHSSGFHPHLDSKDHTGISITLAIWAAVSAGVETNLTESKVSASEVVRSILMNICTKLKGSLSCRCLDF